MIVTSEDVAQRLAGCKLDLLRLVGRHAEEALRGRVQGLWSRVAEAGVPHRRRGLQHHLAGHGQEQESQHLSGPGKG